MVAHGILFIVLPLAVAWFAGVTAYLPPYSLPAPKTEPVEPEFEAEVRAFLAQHSEPDAVADRRMVGARVNTPTIVRNLADCMRMRATLRVLCRSPGARWARSIPTRSSASAFFEVSETVGHGRDDDRPQRQRR